VALGEIVELPGEPAVAAHHVWICYQTERLGPGLQQVVALIRQMAEDKNVFV
jgi:hypothetical protein